MTCSSQAYRQRLGERGAALLAVLVMTATLSGLAVLLLQDIRGAIARTGALRVAEQAYWHALSAETLAAAIIQRSVKAEPDHADLESPWAGAPRKFPIEGGVISGEVRDGGNCFNLNSLVRRAGDGRYVHDARMRAQFAALLAALEIDRGRAQAIVAATRDWLDDDARPSPRGGEDAAYAGRAMPHRTPGAPMAELSELRAVQGIDAALYRRLAPLVCAHPTPAPSRLNVNTLREADGPLLVMLTDGALTLFDARSVIADRPAGGYASSQRFWQHPAFREIEIDEATRAQVGVMTRYYELRAAVRYYDARIALASLYHLDERGRLTRLRRRLEPGL